MEGAKGREIGLHSWQWEQKDLRAKILFFFQIWIDKLPLVGKKRGGNEETRKNNVWLFQKTKPRIAKNWVQTHLEFPLVPILALVANTEASELLRRILWAEVGKGFARTLIGGE